jgi:hypothetical protein
MVGCDVHMKGPDSTEHQMPARWGKGGDEVSVQVQQMSDQGCFIPPMLNTDYCPWQNATAHQGMRVSRAHLYTCRNPEAYCRVRQAQINTH